MEIGHIGTGFVVGPGLVATNCHVLRELLKPKAAVQPGTAGNLELDGKYVIDFGDRRLHDAGVEFAIEGVAGRSTRRFMDVALLRVAARSRAGNHELPAAIPLRTRPIERDWPGKPLPVGIIGYPDLVNLVGDEQTRAMFRQIWESGADNVKLFSPGEVVGLDPQGGIDFLDHVASTHAGQSGSPVLDRTTGEAVGIHYCCTWPGVPENVDALDCSSARLSDRRNNEAISTWSAAADEVLRPFLSGAAVASARGRGNRPLTTYGESAR